MGNGRPVDLLGQRHGRLIVVSLIGSRRNARNVSERWWHLRCDCGSEIERRTKDALRVRSCGCETSERMAAQNWKHGHTVRGHMSPTYKSWFSMHQRCYRPSCNGYVRYGGRGITVCDRWFVFEHFVADMGERPVGTTLDRINNNGNYELTNCRWSVAEVQQNNKRNAVLLTYDGRTQTIQQWSRETCLRWTVIWQRIHRYKWPIEEALTRAPNLANRQIQEAIAKGRTGQRSP